jgi:hypothetical protein
MAEEINLLADLIRLHTLAGDSFRSARAHYLADPKLSSDGWGRTGNLKTLSNAREIGMVRHQPISPHTLMCRLTDGYFIFCRKNF